MENHHSLGTSSPSLLYLRFRSQSKRLSAPFCCWSDSGWTLSAKRWLVLGWNGPCAPSQWAWWRPRQSVGRQSLRIAARRPRLGGVRLLVSRVGCLLGVVASRSWLLLLRISACLSLLEKFFWKEDVCRRWEGWKVRVLVWLLWVLWREKGFLNN